MNGFDLLVLVIVLFCLIRGYFKGLIREVSGIIGVIVGFYGANTYYQILTPYLEPVIETPWVRNLICFFALFCGILISISLIAGLIRKLLSLVFLGWVDRFFGLVFGAAKGVLIVSVLFIMMMTFIPWGNPIFIRLKIGPPHWKSLKRYDPLFFQEYGKRFF